MSAHWEPTRFGSPSQGSVMARHGLAASEHTLAAELGIATLRRGGNAADAAVAMAMALAVLMPHRCHLGGDAFCIVAWHDGGLTAINGSGAAPRATEVSALNGEIPARGPLASTVPGFVGAVAELHRRYGSLPWAELLLPAIAFAEEGIPVTAKLHATIEAHVPLLSRFPSSAEVFLPGGQVPRPGSWLKQPGAAKTLRTIAYGGADAFYKGDIARRIDRFMRETGGWLRVDDFAAFAVDVQPPISTVYRGYTIYEQPPVSQGLIVLEALNIIEGFDLPALGHLTADCVHILSEAVRRAFADRRAFMGDPRYVDTPVERLLSKAFTAERRATIDRERVQEGVLAIEALRDTTYFCVVDGQRNAISFIQSVFTAFGSGVVAGDTGVLLNNRLRGFVLNPQSPNVLQPGKRPMHTLNTYLVMKDGRPFLVGGTPGGDMQVLTNVQVLTGILDFGLDVQSAIDAPRWMFDADGHLQLEERFPAETKAALEAKGQRVDWVPPWYGGTGRANVILIDPETGGLVGGSDLRGEGAAIGY